jgi:CHAD domain-containing protein
MHKALLKQTRKIEKAAATLRRDYDVESLHALRVAIRRIRSLLKGRGRGRLRRLRRTWGAFARVTNRARDWDVFLEQAERLLSPAESRRFRATCRGTVEASREAVIAMLCSPHWSAQLAEWRGYLENQARAQPNRQSQRSGPQQPDRLAASIHKANVVLALAPDDNDDAAWHRLRIAVKEARYQAERAAGETAGLDPRTVVRTCKALQTSLGAWHDCVVQLRLLTELERQSPGAADLLRELRPKIEQLRVQHLERARNRLARQAVFAAGPCPDSGTKVSFG